MLGWVLAVMCGLLVLVFGAAHYAVIRMGEEQRQDRENRLRWSTPSPPVRPRTGASAGAVFAAAEAAPVPSGVAAEVKEKSEQNPPPVTALLASDLPAGAEGAVEGLHALISLEGQEDIEVVSSDVCISCVHACLIFTCVLDSGVCMRQAV